MSSASDSGATPLACDMSAMAPEERAEHQELAGRLFGELLRERRELADGFAFRFDAEHLPLLAAFVARERLCCPFLTFRLELGPAGGPLWIQLTGPAGAKQILLAELGG